jgi:signal transduction histidine kinase
MSPNVLSLTGPMRPTAPFPNSSRPETGAPAPRQKKADQQSINILLVDDQPAKLLSYEAILGELGDNLIKASSAAEALEQLLKYDIAVILVDVCMPELDGFELAAMIRDHPRFQSISIIFVSAVQVTDLDLLRGYGLGGVDYVAVPIIPELLRAKVRVFAELFRKTRQLEKMNDELESRVAARTAELASANAELEQRVEERTREREEALYRVHEMQKIESLGQLTGGVAHDFNNLLMAVLGNLELVKKYSADEPPIRRWVDHAIEAAERGAALTKRMLAFARRQELRPEIVNVPNLVDGMTEMLQRLLGPTVQVRTDFDAGVAPVRVDPNELECALLNLALNARDATPSAGHRIDLIIAARSERIEADEVAGLEPGEYVRIGVKDTGCGMDEATLRRACEPFFTTKDKGRGTGLGLSMVHGFAAQSGGAMQITSRVGGGTLVELWVPVADGAVADLLEPAAAPARAANTRSLRVLVVDDDPFVGESTAAMIEDLGHMAINVESAAGALEVMRSEPSIDIVITDYAMPGKNGAELAADIRQSRPDLPVVISTGYADAPWHALDLPRLDKPYQQGDLAALIEGYSSRGIISPRA